MFEVQPANADQIEYTCSLVGGVSSSAAGEASTLRISESCNTAILCYTIPGCCCQQDVICLFTFH